MLHANGYPPVARGFVGRVQDFSSEKEEVARSFSTETTWGQSSSGSKTVITQCKGVKGTLK